MAGQRSGGQSVSHHRYCLVLTLATVDGSVDEDAEGPGLERAAAAEAPQLLHEVQPGLLGDLLGYRPTADVVEGYSDH